jgi:hypothetical protein
MVDKLFAVHPGETADSGFQQAFLLSDRFSLGRGV